MKKRKLIPLLLKHSGLTASGLIVFFLLMRLLQLAVILELRFLNFIILFFGIRFFLLRLKRENNGSLQYLHSLAYGFIVSLLTSVFFSLFIFLYLSFIDRHMMEYLQLNQPFGEYLTSGFAALVMILEGCSSGAIISFVLVQFMSRERKVTQPD